MRQCLDTAQPLAVLVVFRAHHGDRLHDHRRGQADQLGGLALALFALRLLTGGRRQRLPVGAAAPQRV